MNGIDIAKSSIISALDKKAVNPVLLDMRGHSDICDFQFICSGTNDRQTRAIAENIEVTLKKSGIRPFGIEGKNGGNWILLDFGQTLIHIFDETQRNYYAIEQVWPNAKAVDIEKLLKP